MLGKQTHHMPLISESSVHPASLDPQGLDALIDLDDNFCSIRFMESST